MVARYESDSSQGDPNDGFNRLSHVSNQGYGTLTESLVRSSEMNTPHNRMGSESSEEEVTREVLSRSDHVNIDLCAEGEHEVIIPQEPLKTFWSFLFLLTGFLTSTFSLVMTHERVPDTQPLPDLILDNVEFQKWGLDMSEIILITNVLIGFIVVIFHSHRIIILRRIWFILGLLYFYRAITMCVTVLPKSDAKYVCRPKEDHITFVMILKRVLTIASGGGLSINGHHVYCGDYIFSGHTLTLVMAYLVIRQYSPSKFKLLHVLSLVLTILGVCFLLLGRGHYTIDVLIAYFVTTRLWYMYHTVAHHQLFKTKEEGHFFDKFFWWHIARYFEANVVRILPETYSLPVPKRILNSCKRQESVGRYNSMEGQE